MNLLQTSYAYSIIENISLNISKNSEVDVSELLEILMGCFLCTHADQCGTNKLHYVDVHTIFILWSTSDHWPIPRIISYGNLKAGASGGNVSLVRIVVSVYTSSIYYIVLPIVKTILGDALEQQLEDAKSERREAELRREDLVKKAKLLQNKAQNRRNQGMSNVSIILTTNKWNQLFWSCIS